MDEKARAPRYQLLADELRSQIMTGELRAGARLPAEPDLTLHYDVSRSTWREALRTLAAENLVIATRGVAGGTFVIEPSIGDVESYLSNSVSLLMRSQLPLEHILTARSFLEVPAAGLAAIHRRDEHLTVLSASIDALDADDRSDLWQANARFHTTLLDATGNPLLRALIAPVSGALRAKIVDGPERPAIMEDAARDHRSILEAVRAREARAAEAAMREHLTRLEAAYLHYLNEKGGSAQTQDRRSTE